MDGWIKLHRKLLCSNIFDNEKALKVWIWCLMKASHKDFEPIIGTQIVKLKQGQFVFGRNKAAEELKMKPSTVYLYMDLLKRNGNISIKPNNKYSIVTIEKWATYQLAEESIDNKITTKQQQNNTYKNDKNIKNIYISKRKINERKYSKEFLDNLVTFGG